MSSNLSVHFSPDTLRQSRGFIAVESRAIDSTFGSIDQPDRSFTDSITPGSSRSLEAGTARINRELDPNTLDPEQHRQIRASRVGRRGAPISSQTHALC
jgi:hypothetical protein